MSAEIFISYAREDEILAKTLAEELKQARFTPFLDTELIDPGDNFVSKLKHAVKRCEGMVPLISEHYKDSRWCQTELYQALTADKLVVPLVLNENALNELDAPLQRLLRDIQYTVIDKGVESPATLSFLTEKLATARKRARRQKLLRFTSFIMAVSLCFAGIYWLTSNLNNLQQTKTRNSVLSKVERSDGIFQTDQIQQLAESIVNDEVAYGKLHYFADDPSLSDITRLNALLLSTAIRPDTREYRWYPENISISNTKMDNSLFISTSFLNNDWNGVSVTDGLFANVNFGPAETTRFSNLYFNNTLIVGSVFDAISLTGAEFVDTKFTGSTIDTTNFSKVIFRTDEPSDPAGGNPVITPRFGKFDRSTIISRRSPPDSTVLDLSLTGDDIVFENITFVDCKLVGWFRAEWFRSSTFEDCQLPLSLSKNSLEEAGNVVMD